MEATSTRLKKANLCSSRLLFLLDKREKRESSGRHAPNFFFLPLCALALARFPLGSKETETAATQAKSESIFCFDTLLHDVTSQARREEVYVQVTRRESFFIKARHA